MDENFHIITFLIIFSSLSIEIQGNNETINTTDSAPLSEVKNSTLTLEEKVCQQFNICQPFAYDVENQYNDLKTRECMCDEACVVYDDCCTDSPYHNGSRSTDKKFACSYTPYDGFIYKLSKCLSNYSNKEIIRYCETTDENILVRDVTLTIPVVNEATNTTYRNIFCAFCNNDMQVKFWDAVLNYDLVSRNEDEIISSNLDSGLDDKNKYTVPLTLSDFDLLLGNLKVSEKNQTLISQFNGSTYKCEINANMPSNFKSAARFCRPQEARCTLCQKSNCSNVAAVPPENFFFVNLKDQRLPKINHCNYLPPSGINFSEYWCHAEPIEKKDEDIEDCFLHTEEGKPCLINSFFSRGTEFEYADNNTVYVYRFKANFSIDEWTESTEGNHSIYVCGTYMPMGEEEKWYSAINNVLTEVFIKFSIFFLVVFLVISAKKQKLQSLPNKIIFSFCSTLLALYVSFEVAQILPSCKIAAALIHYLFLSCFAWLLVAAYDFWSVICRSSSKLQTLAGKTRLKRYLIYSFFGWISPLSIMAVAIYFELAVNSKIGCPNKPGYGRLAQCFMAQQQPAYWFFYYPSAVVFCTIITLFAHTSYHIYQSKRKHIKSTAQNNYYMLFAKLAMTMGLTWTLGMLVTYTGILFFRTLYVIFNASQGTFMFFAYGFKREMLNKILKTPKNNTSSVTQQTKSTSVTMTDRMKNRSLPSTSVDPSSQDMESSCT